MNQTLFSKQLYLVLLFVLANSQAQAMSPVTPPNFSIPDVGYYGSWVWPNAGWNLIWGNPGDGNSNPASTASGAVIKRSGMYSATGTNIVEAWCAPNYYWIYQGYGIQPFGWTFHDADERQLLL